MFARRCVSAALVGWVAWSSPLQAAVLQLAPIPIEVPAPEKAAVLSLANKASSEVTLQLRVFRWSQDGGAEKLVPTRALAVSPPLAVVPAGQALTVRVVRLAGAPPAAEESYRIWVDELPVGRESAPAGGALRILMRYSVPVFYEPAGADGVEPPLAWRLSRGADGEWRLTASNAGRRRVNLTRLHLASPDGRATLPDGAGLAGYVLAGSRMRWTLSAPQDFPVASGGYRLTYSTEASESHRETLALVREK